MKDICSTNCKNEIAIKNNRDKISGFETLDKTVEFFKLLGNQSRIKILLILLDDELCVCDIAESIELSIPATSQQLKSLRLARILKQRNEGKTVYYTFEDDNSRKLIKKLILNTIE